MNDSLLSDEGLRLPAKAAFANAQAERVRSRWPARADTENRLGQECWPILKPLFKIPRSARVFTIGSCFARNIEAHLVKHGLDVPAARFAVPPEEWGGRPNGILNKYTPPSFFQEIELNWALLNATGEEHERLLNSPLLTLTDGDVIDLELTGLNPVTRERGLERRKQIYELHKSAFDADFIVLTLGLLECWYDKVTERYIQQAPTGPRLRGFSDRFEYRLMEYSEAHSYVERTLALLLQNGKPNKRVLMTVSPVPIDTTLTGQDVIVANMYAKSTLRSVVESIRRRFDNVDYFPSYESVILSKDSGVWEDDQIHVTDRFVKKVVDRLVDAYLE